METRIIRTDFWEDDKIVSLNIDTKLLYLCLLTNPKIGQLRIYPLNDRQMSFLTGFSIEQLKKCKSDLELEQLAYFHNGFVCITGSAYVESSYSGGKNAVAKQKKINEIPEEDLEHFNSLLNSLSIPYRYHIDRDLNLNNKSKEDSEKKKTETIGIEFTETSDVWQLNDDDPNTVSFKS